MQFGLEEIDGKGRMLPAVFETICSNENGKIMAAGVAVGVPRSSNNKSGVIFACSSWSTEKLVVQQLEKMVAEGMKEKKIY